MKQAKYSFKEETDVMNFGSYEGHTIGEIMKTDPKYIRWCMKNFKGFKLYKKLQDKFNSK